MADPICVDSVWHRHNEDGSYSVGLRFDNGREIVLRRFELTEMVFTTDDCSPVTSTDYADGIAQQIWPTEEQHG